MLIDACDAARGGLVVEAHSLVCIDASVGRARCKNRRAAGAAGSQMLFEAGRGARHHVCISRQKLTAALEGAASDAHPGRLVFDAPLFASGTCQVTMAPQHVDPLSLGDFHGPQHVSSPAGRALYDAACLLLPAALGLVGYPSDAASSAKLLRSCTAIQSSAGSGRGAHIDPAHDIYGAVVIVNLCGEMLYNFAGTRKVPSHTRIEHGDACSAANIGPATPAANCSVRLLETA